jgi:Ras-related protein Ral-A
MNDKFPEVHDTTIEDQYKITTNVNGNECNVEILDTAGQDDYQSMLDSWIAFADGFILVFSVDDSESLEVVKDRIEKIFVLKYKDSKNKPPIVVVGNKCDLENRKISYTEVYDYCKKLGLDYLECSALNKTNVKEAFIKIFEKLILINKPEKEELNSKQTKKCFCF